ncbi:MAG: hypothetical protein AABZ06_01160 [Bdellovibrionota bacterium]
MLHQPGNLSLNVLKLNLIQGFQFENNSFLTGRVIGYHSFNVVEMTLSVKQFQAQLIAKAKDVYSHSPLSEKVISAFYVVPRHEFVQKYRFWSNPNWFEVNSANIEQHLAALYADQPVIIYGSDEDFESRGVKPVSTISQPSFVLRMIDLLRLEPGHKVFELGAGSAWNAALMGNIIGPTGKVVSLEIIPDLIAPANSTLKRLGIDNVDVLLGDGGDGCKEYGPYDRAVFTAGSFDLPQSFFRQIKNGGLLLFVLKNKGGADNLILLEKREDHFASIFSMSCGFVPMTGKYRFTDFDAKPLDEILNSAGIKTHEIDKNPFWWAGTTEDNFIWANAGLRSFLSISEPMLEIVAIGSGKTSFGILDKEQKSFMLAKYDSLISFGSTRARDHFISSMKSWIDIGMPGLSTLEVRAYPKGINIHIGHNEWVSNRAETTFIWRLP